MERVAEPELMDRPAHARAYARADFAEPHDRLIDRFAACFPGARPRQVLDLGCGPGDVSWRFARAHPEATVVGVDASLPMLEEGRRLLAGHPEGRRVRLVAGRLPAGPLRRHAFDTVIANSLLHHLTDPGVLWSAIREHGAPGAMVFAADLRRPPSAAAAALLVASHAGGEPALLRDDFLASLHAAYRPDEVRAQLDAAGLPELAVDAVGDRHLVAWGRLP